MNRYLLVLSAVFCLVSCKSGIPAFRHTASQAPDPVKVKVQTVRMEPSEERHSFVGEVVSSRSTLISAPHPGKLVSLEVKKGDVVKEGQVLARISSSTVESAYKIASANLEQAKDGYDRATQVYAEGNVSEIQYMDIKTKLQQAEAATSGFVKMAWSARPTSRSEAIRERGLSFPVVCPRVSAILICPA